LTRTLALAALTLTLSPLGARAAETTPPLGDRKLAVLAGVGTTTAGYGLQAELRFGRHFSAFGGFGYSPESQGEYSSRRAEGAGVAGGLRAYTPGRIHQAFVEVAVAPITSEQGTQGLFLRYAPTFQAGWQMTRAGGFTLVLSLGVGHAPANAQLESDTSGVFSIGLGHTWRRK